MELAKKLKFISTSMTEFEYIDMMISNEYSIGNEGKKKAL